MRDDRRHDRMDQSGGLVVHTVREREEHLDTAFDTVRAWRNVPDVALVIGDGHLVLRTT